MDGTPQEAYAEYLTHNHRFSPGWVECIQTFTRALADNCDSPLPMTPSQYQVKNMARAAKTVFTPTEQRLYSYLREAQTPEGEIRDDNVVRPSMLTDQRLMIEICLLTGNQASVLALIEQYPSVRSAA